MTKKTTIIFLFLLAICRLSFAGCNLFAGSEGSDPNDSGSTKVELGFTLNKEGTEYSVTGYKNSAPKAQIPSEYNGLPVVSIGESAFSACSGLASVTFTDPNGWRYSSSSTATSGTSIPASTLSDPTKAATYLKADYARYYWRRS